MKIKIYTKKKLILLFKDLETRIGGQPTKKQWNEDALTPSSMTVRSQFGNWTNFMKTFKLKPLKGRPTRTRKGIKNKKGVSRQRSASGYVQLFKPEHPTARKNGYAMEHRMIAYDAGILTNLSMDVHHKNGNKNDNKIENLEVLSKEKHTSITHKGRKRGRWSDKRRETKSKQMNGNKNWKGNTYTTPELLSDNK